MESLKKYKPQILFHLLLNLIVGLFISFSSYYHLPLNYFSDYAIYLIHFFILQFTVFGFLYILSFNKYLFYSFFPLLFFTYSMFAYWIYTQDISISYSIMQAVIESKPDIAFDLLSTQLIFYILVVITAIFYLLKQYSKLKFNQITSPLFILALIGVITFFTLNNYGFGNLKWRMPYNLTYSFIEYNNKPVVNYIPINENIYSKSDSLNIVFVLGESVRAKNLGINGYYRNTTPKLLKTENLVSFPNVYTPLTYTGVSVPQILTSKSILNENNSTNLHTIYSILNKLNYKTTWIGNQTPEKSYEFLIDQNQTVKLIDNFHDVFSFKKKLDEELLPVFIKSFKKDKNTFTTIHMIGSHWWYESRYSRRFEKFKPIVDSKHIPSLSKEQIKNSYDNTILYLDDFLNNLIVFIKKKKHKNYSNIFI